MIHYLLFGIVLGLSAGFAPGPLFALVISETLRHGVGSGIRVSLAPVITDLPIIFVSLFVLAKLSGFNTVLGIVSLLGGLFVFYMGWQNIRAGSFSPDQAEALPQSLAKGVLVNFLSPHPYLFWLSVGAPVVLKAAGVNGFAPILFVGGFYAMLIGSKVFLAVLAGRSKTFLAGRKYVLTMRILGGALCLLSLVLVRDGLKFLRLF
ncbi:MAG: LysE family translocator [Proteobacteria bacterium]|nr:LysE family translocator [Pseudomonadota bacterium]MBU1737446.1 LysE family translocator [Pseudomonadota bacterium]